MSFELADYPLNKTRSAKHKNSMYYMMRRTRNLTPGDSTGKNLPLIWKTKLRYSHIEDVRFKDCSLHL